MPCGNDESEEVNVKVNDESSSLQRRRPQSFNLSVPPPRFAAQANPSSNFSASTPLVASACALSRSTTGLTLG